MLVCLKLYAVLWSGWLNLLVNYSNNSIVSNIYSRAVITQVCWDLELIH